MSADLIKFVRDYYGTDGSVPLHSPVFHGRELEYVADTINSTFVSSIGAYVNRFERDIERYTGSSKAVATVNGTAGLHIALRLAGVGEGDLVVTQALTFVATCNAIAYCGAEPVFIDVDKDTLGLSPSALSNWLDEHAYIDDAGVCRTFGDNRVIRACVPMHTFGHPANLEGLLSIADSWGLCLIEDAAESLGSFYKGKHTGTFGKLGVFSFNGNKILTTGGGGMIVSDNNTGMLAKHLTTTAKQPHPYEYVHDQIGYNYRLPNINAALGCAQLEQIESFIKAKRTLAEGYRDVLRSTDLQYFSEPKDCRSNYWLNAVICENLAHRDSLLEATNSHGIMTRPIWQLMCRLPMYRNCLKGSLPNSKWAEARVVNLPSSVVA